MTGRELLYMYARLRGVPEVLIPKVVEDLINALLLQEHADKLTSLYRYAIILLVSFFFLLRGRRREWLPNLPSHARLFTITLLLIVLVSISLLTTFYHECCSLIGYAARYLFCQEPITLILF